MLISICMQDFKIRTNDREDIHMQDRRKREIRIVADSFRDICNVSRYGILDLFKECERSGYKLIRYPLGHDADLGFSLKKDNDVIIFTNSCSRLSREIFTLAHEIGHVMLHFNDEPSFVDNNHSISGYDSNENEQEANYFAACLLMPEEVINRFIDLELPEFQNNGLSAMDIARISMSLSLRMWVMAFSLPGLFSTNIEICLISGIVSTSYDFFI